MKYKLVSLSDGVLTVEYETGVSVNIDLPIENDKFPEGKELDRIVNEAYPGWYVERIEKLKRVKNAEKIKVQGKPAKDNEKNNPAPEDPAFREYVRGIVLEELAKL